MAMRHLSILSLVLILFLPAESFAGGPVYSRYGLGDLRLFSSSRGYAMGGTAIGLTGDGFINRVNPAGNARIAFTRFSGSFEYQNVSSSDPLGDGSFARGDVQALAVAIPISVDRGSVITIDGAPLSAVRYKIQANDVRMGISSRQTFSGTGGLSRLSFGTSYTIDSVVTVALKLNYMFGRIGQNLEVDFDDPTYTDSELLHSDFYRALNVTIGAMHNISKNTTIGLIIGTPARFSIRNENLTFSEGFLDTVTTADRSLRWPLSYGLGFSSLLNNRYVLAGDASIQEWSKAEFTAYPGVAYRNSLRLGLGLEIQPIKGSSGYWQNTFYRFGAGYYQSYLEMKGAPINEYFVTGGVGLPIGPDARLNIGLQLGTRGTSSNALQKETFVRLGVTISASEEWFLKFEDE